MRLDLYGMKTDIEMLKSAFGNALKVGPVEEIDAKRGYRLKLGEGADGPFLSPWYPHPETGKTSVPLKKGQIVGVINPTGDMRQGLMFRGGYSDGNPSPNDNMEANVFEDAGVRMVVADNALTITAGDTSVVIAAGGITMKSARIDLN
ncbi:baseplate assembly protein [Terrihabitans rhizophilus]|uniref:Baseplate assembly protein n=1 Tax=Terrihabitans rhizophilus TaxID=3092662 RepID=A0ABU4RN92_9HYPH|nr:baseplate assembly protein [Terrihabitans sp. PJ23]MDX6806316.1 baseplate assembly protein [Terrihabitans sp. PJ23]